MTVLQLCLAYPPNINGGGACRVATELTGELVEAGHSIQVIAPKLRGATFRRSLFRTERVANRHFEIVYLGTWVQRGFKTLNPAAFRMVARGVLRSDVTVVHGLRTFIGTFGSLWCLYTGRPYVLFPHGMTVRRWRSIFLKTVYDTVIGNAILRNASAILCSTERERSEIIQAVGCPPQKVEVVAVCAWRNTPRPKAPGWTTAKLVFLGRVVREKGLELVLEALRRSAFGDKFSVEIHGPIEDEGYAAELQNTFPRVILRGPVYGAPKDEMLASSHLLALVSEYESYGLVAQEAIQAGTPVLVADTCGIAPEVTPDVGIVTERSVEAIRRQLDRLAESDFAELRKLIASCAGAGSRGPLKTMLATIESKAEAKA